MRVGIFTYGMGEHLTGIGRYTQELCYALLRVHRNIEVILVNPYPVSQQAFFQAFENYHVPALNKLPAVLGSGPLLIPYISNKMRLDVFHDPCGISPFLLPRRNQSARRVVSIHDAVPYVFPHVQPFLTRLTFRTFIPASRWSVDAVLAPSESSRQDLLRYVGFSADKVHVAFPGVLIPSEEELLERRLKSSSVLKKYGLSNPYFLYVGALNPRKNVPTLIGAFEQLLKQRNDVKLVLVGPETWWADESIREAQRFQESVKITGYIDDEELGCLYASASALVYPSIYEGFGLPPLEAMAHGTPVITSNVSSLPEVVGDAGIMINPTDIASLVTAMTRVLDEDVALELSRKGRLRAHVFNWDNTARDVFEVYEQVLSDRVQLV